MIKGHRQHDVKKFAAASVVIPRTLAENARGVEGGEQGCLSALGGTRSLRTANGAGWGIDIQIGPPSYSTILADSNSLPYPILDSLAAKHCVVKLATALTADMSWQVGQGN